VLQHMDQGVILSLKRNFRRMLGNAIIKWRAVDNITLQECTGCNEGPHCELGQDLTEDISACKHARFFKQDSRSSDRSW
jgi:hypothetical protein